MLQWAASMARAAAAACPPLPIETPLAAVVCWHSLNGELRPPDSFLVGLQSACRTAGFQVHLYAYQHLEGIPGGVVLQDAGSVWGREEFDAALDSKVPVQVLADYIRAKALQAAGRGGWFLDGDAIWLRAAPRMSLTDPQAMGHFFACQDAALRGHTKDQLTRHWLTEFLMSPGDQLCLASPWAFPPKSPVLDQYVALFPIQILGPCKKNTTTA